MGNMIVQDSQPLTTPLMDAAIKGKDMTKLITSKATNLSMFVAI